MCIVDTASVVSSVVFSTFCAIVSQPGITFTITICILCTVHTMCSAEIVRIVCYCKHLAATGYQILCFQQLNNPAVRQLLMEMTYCITCIRCMWYSQKVLILGTLQPAIKICLG